ncbi:MAG TPA: VOC family protein, partial [bacterium]|nr:VOC family protein [bacterium]
MNTKAGPGRSLGYRMPAEARLTSLTLRVRDLARLQRFYADLLGLHVQPGGPDHIGVGPEGKAFALELVQDPQAPVRPHPSVGLYHFALLLPDRPQLAAVVRRLMEAEWPFEGASDHGVSEALYLRDPEGNGIELYRDRPDGEWPHRNGELAMVSQALDVSAQLAEAPTSAPIHPATRLGHIHLSVDDLHAGEQFYSTILGLNVTQRSYPGALFLAAGTYHHHVGLNTWAHGRRAPGNATGLTGYAWAVPRGTVDALSGHLGTAGV